MCFIFYTNDRGASGFNICLNYFQDLSGPYLHRATLLGILDKHTICERDLRKSWPPPPPIISLLPFFSFLPSQCSSVCHGDCLSKQTDDGLWRDRRHDVELFAFVAPVRIKVFLRGTLRFRAERRDKKPQKKQIFTLQSWSDLALFSVRWMTKGWMGPFLVQGYKIDVILRCFLWSSS